MTKRLLALTLVLGAASLQGADRLRVLEEQVSANLPLACRLNDITWISTQLINGADPAVRGDLVVGSIADRFFGFYLEAMSTVVSDENTPELRTAVIAQILEEHQDLFSLKRSLYTGDKGYYGKDVGYSSSC